MLMVARCDNGHGRGLGWSWSRNYLPPWVRSTDLGRHRRPQIGSDECPQRCQISSAAESFIDTGPRDLGPYTSERAAEAGHVDEEATSEALTLTSHRASPPDPHLHEARPHLPLSITVDGVFETVTHVCSLARTSRGGQCYP